ncbi:MAG: histidinol dehydrogenase [Clostridia bacterium]|nr:histidinol dehydrogenase [Christensenellaceae bacterium]MBR6239628.1 histidinol dehydrogenase [Clostridia bacterium]
MIRIFRYGEVPNSEIFARSVPTSDVSGPVSEIIENIRKNGDRALIEYALRFDKAQLTSLKVSEEEIDDAFEAADPEFIRILERAAENIRRFHRMQLREGFTIEGPDGVIMGQKIIPIEKAALYIPGGTASYPSTVLMSAIPAKLAGCSTVVMVSPPSSDGSINPAILVAARIAGIDSIYKTGGAQAIAALAYGTETVPKVDKIVGPGNAYVQEAKRQVFGEVSIDMIAGPSEILIVADKTASARVTAADLLSQAEHDRNSSAVLVTDSMDFAMDVSSEIEDQIPALLRKDIARASIDNNGKIIVADDIIKAIDIANEIAPEHFELCIDDPFRYLDLIKNAGSVFLGHDCPEALGDYMAGPNHTLPTSGTARFSSPLSVDDFIKKTQFTYFTKEALSGLARDVEAFANVEGLTGHAKSAVIRFEEDGK